MLSLDELRRRLAEKGYRHHGVESLLREAEDSPRSPAVLHQVERFLTADCERVFRTWFGDRDYKKHMNLAAVECAERAIGCLLDYSRREG